MHLLLLYRLWQNVIKNKQLGTKSGTIFSCVCINIYDSCIINNIAPYSIDADSGAEIYNTIFDKVSSNCIVKSNAMSPFNNYLQFIETGACEAEGAKTFDKIKKTICIVTCKQKRKSITDLTNVIILTLMNMMK